MAVPVPTAEVETMVTLQKLQEALEEEVLTRQSLSRELEAIRTANQNFSRSGSRCWGEGRGEQHPSQSPHQIGRLTHLPIFPQPTTGGRGPEPRPGGACSAATGADGDAAGPRSRRRVPHPLPARGSPGGDGGHVGCVNPRGGVQAGAPQPRHCLSPSSTLHTPLSSPSSHHGDPQSPGHGSTFPCKTPLSPPRPPS